jgi:hypothetical protein
MAVRPARHERELQGECSSMLTRRSRVRLRIVETVRLLSALPRLGHAGRKHGTREFAVPHLPYIVVYRVDIADED